MRYYSTQRPVGIGTFPKPVGNKVKDIYNRDRKGHNPGEGLDYWGYIDYEHELSPKDIEDYELTPEIILDEFVGLPPSEPGNEIQGIYVSTQWRMEKGVMNMKSERITPPSNHICKEGIKAAHEEFMKWLETEEGQHYAKLSEEQQKGVEDDKQSTD